MHDTENTPNQVGMTLLEIVIVLSMLLILAALAYPGYSRQRLRAQITLCTNNQRVIMDAKQVWALETGKNDADTPTAAELEPFLRSGMRLKCPAVRGVPASFDEHYHIGTVGEATGCKIRPVEHTF